MMSFHSDILQAMQLTRQGQLSEATSTLQAMLNGEASATDTNPYVDMKTVFESPFSFSPGFQPAQVGQPFAFSIKDSLKAGLPNSWSMGKSSAIREDIAPAAGQFLTKSYSNAAGSRAYKLYIPSDLQEGETLPLIVMLHGCTQSADDFAAGTRMNHQGEKKRFFVAYPEQAMAANSSKCWNWFKPQDQQRGKGEPSLIAGITEQVMADYPVDASRIYIAGLSAGGAGAAIMGQAYPDLYAAIGVHSGLASGAAHDLPSALAAMRQGGAKNRSVSKNRIVPTISFHGDRDMTVNPCNGDQVIEEALSGDSGLTARQQNGQVPDGHPYERTLHSDSTGKVMLEHWLIKGAGHAWSGGSTAGSYTDSKGPNASREMIRFFLEHSLKN